MCGIFPLCFARRVRLFPPFFLGRLYHGLCSVSLTLFCDPFRQLTRVAGRTWEESRRQEERLRSFLPPAPRQQPQATRTGAPIVTPARPSTAGCTEISSVFGQRYYHPWARAPAAWGPLPRGLSSTLEREIALPILWAPAAPDVLMLVPQSCLTLWPHGL